MATLLTETRPVDIPAVERVPAVPPRPAEKPARLMSLDAYRGFIMLAMASGGLALGKVWQASFPDNSMWRFLAFQTGHVDWTGCSFWDLIQPSFMFMVGVALPYSYASRKARGATEGRMFLHTLWRSLLLVLLAIFLSTSIPGTKLEPPVPRTNFVFTNVLAQIGLGYTFLYVLVGRGWRWQLGVLAAILAGYTLFFGLYPKPGPDFPWQSVGVPKDWPHPEGWFAHWDKNTNAAAWFDVWFLNLFPRQTPLVFSDGGYQTLNFIPSLATMLLGLMAGEFLRRPNTHLRRFAVLMSAGVVCLGLGLLMGLFLCPIVKRIWTPSWAVYSAGWTFLMLALFYAVIDGLNWRRWAFPLVVVGMNSIAMYCMAQLVKGWFGKALRIHLGPLAEGSARAAGPRVELWATTFAPIVEQCAILLILWLICLWMYRRGLFLRI